MSILYTFFHTTASCLPITGQYMAYVNKREIRELIEKTAKESKGSKVDPSNFSCKNLLEEPLKGGEEDKISTVQISHLRQALDTLKKESPEAQKFCKKYIREIFPKNENYLIFSVISATLLAVSLGVVAVALNLFNNPFFFLAFTIPLGQLFFTNFERNFEEGRVKEFCEGYINGFKKGLFLGFKQGLGLSKA